MTYWKVKDMNSGNVCKDGIGYEGIFYINKFKSKEEAMEFIKSLPQGHGFVNPYKIFRFDDKKGEGKGWRESPGRDGKAPIHKEVATRAQAGKANNKPMKKADYQDNVGHQSNVRYRGYQIDYTLRKERGMNRYEGNMIIYSDDLKFIVRSTLSYLPDNSIQHVFNQADEILKRHNMGDATFVDEERRKQNIISSESYKTKRSPRTWKKIGEFRYERARDGMVVGIEKMPTGGYMAFGQMPNRPPFDLYDVNNGEEWIHREDLEEKLKDWMKGAS